MLKSENEWSVESVTESFSCRIKRNHLEELYAFRNEVFNLVSINGLK
jgi:hypothetical protein